MSQNRLYMHCGATPVEKNEVYKANTPTNTDTHYPIPHGVFLDNVFNTLNEVGLVTTNEHYGLNHEGNDLFALLEIERGDGGDDGNGTFTNAVGLRNSHIKHFSASLVAGGRVFVCDNLMISGEIKMNRKHTRNILKDLPNLIGHMVLQLVDKWLFQEVRYDAYRDTELTQSQADELLALSFRKGCIPGSKLQKVVNEWEEPNHEEFQPRNAWSMFNAFTEVHKESPSQLPNRSMRLHNTFNRFCKDAIDDHMHQRGIAIDADISNVEDADILV